MIESGFMLSFLGKNSGEFFYGTGSALLSTLQVFVVMFEHCQSDSMSSDMLMVFLLPVLQFLVFILIILFSVWKHHT